MTAFNPDQDPLSDPRIIRSTEIGNRPTVTLPEEVYDWLVGRYIEAGNARTILDHIPVAIHLFDLKPDGLYFSFVNRAAWNLLFADPMPGIAFPQDLIGRNIVDVGYSDDYLLNLEADVEEAMNSNQSVSRERVIGQENNQRTILGVVTPIRIIGTISNILVSFHDITDLRNLESANRLADEKIEVLSRMTLAATLASAIAHDANSSITSSRGYIQLVIEELKRDDFKQADLISMLQQAMVATTGLKNLMVRLRDSSIVSVESMKNVDISELLQNVISFDLNSARRKLELAGRSLKDLKLSFESSGDTTAFVDSLALRNALVNLVKNSLEAVVMRSPESKGSNYQPAISLRCIADDTNVYIEVTDNGTGITEEDLAKVFDFKFTTKGEEIGLEGGAGQGLYAARQTIILHKGEITVESQPNSFTTFRIRIPKTRPMNEVQETFAK